MEDDAGNASRRQTVTGSGAPGSPERIGHYDLLSLLGKGGMGEVYLAHDTRLDRRVAVKFLSEELHRDPSAKERFIREAKAAAALDHPFICKIFEAGEHNGRSYIVMEYVEGETLRDKIAQGPFSLVDALKVALEAAEALEAAHAKGIVHRDLKPSNLMCTAQGHLKIMDFGLAKHVVSDPGAGALSGTMTMTRTMTAAQPSITGKGVVVGTIAYMSPEQARGEPVDARTDIFSLGVVLTEMISGKHPFDRQTPVETLTAVLRDHPPPIQVKPKVVNPAVGRIIHRALAKDSAQRYQSMSEMAADIRSLLADVAPGKWLGFRSTWVRGGAAVAGLAVLALIGFNLIKPGQRGPAPSPGMVSVLIADVENATGDPMFDGVLEQLLSIGLASVEHILLYERDQARALIRRLDPAAEDRLTAENTRLLSLREGIQAVVNASIRQDKNVYIVEVQAKDPVKGTILTTASQSIRERSDILRIADVLSARLRAGLGVIPEDSSEALIKETFTTTSLEAMKSYVDAQDLNARGRQEEAIAAYLRAVDLDPNFGRAYAGLAVTYYARGEWQLAEKYYDQALARIDQMTDREKHRTRGGYFLFKNNFRRAIEEYTALLKLFPQDVAGHTNLALAYFFGYRMREAFEEGLRALEVEPDNLDHRYNQSWYALAYGDFAMARQEARKTLEIEPSYAKAFVVLALAELADGRREQAVKHYKQVAALDLLGSSFGATGLADLAVYEGRLEEADRILEEGIAADIENKSHYRAADKKLMLAQVRMLQGDHARAAEAAEKAIKLSGREEFLFAAALVFMNAGREDRARTIAGDLGKRVQDIHQAYAKIIGGHLSLARGDTANAVKCFDEAQAAVDTWLGRFGLGRAYLEAGAFTEALSEFEKCERRRGEALSVFLNDLPTVRYLDSLDYYIGRAQEGLAKRAAAKDAYRKFLKIKAGADPGQALVEDAKRRLGAL